MTAHSYENKTIYNKIRRKLTWAICNHNIIYNYDKVAVFASYGVSVLLCLNIIGIAGIIMSLLDFTKSAIVIVVIQFFGIIYIVSLYILLRTHDVKHVEQVTEKRLIERNAVEEKAKNEGKKGDQLKEVMLAFDRVWKKRKVP